MNTNIQIEPAESKIDVTGEIEARWGDALGLAFKVDYEDNPAFWRRVRQRQLGQARMLERLKKKLLRQNGRSPRPRKPAPHGRAALVAAQKKARP